MHPRLISLIFLALNSRLCLSKVHPSVQLYSDSTTSEWRVEYLYFHRLAHDAITEVGGGFQVFRTYFGACSGPPNTHSPDEKPCGWQVSESTLKCDWDPRGLIMHKKKPLPTNEWFKCQSYEDIDYLNYLQEGDDPEPADEWSRWRAYDLEESSAPNPGTFPFQKMKIQLITGVPLKRYVITEASFSSFHDPFNRAPWDQIDRATGLVETTSIRFTITTDMCMFEQADYSELLKYTCWIRNGPKVNCPMPYMAGYDCGFSVNATEEIMPISEFWEKFT